MSYELTTTLKVLTNLIKLRLNLQVAEIASSNVVKMVF